MSVLVYFQCEKAPRAWVSNTARTQVPGYSSSKETDPHTSDVWVSLETTLNHPQFFKREIIILISMNPTQISLNIFLYDSKPWWLLSSDQPSDHCHTHIHHMIAAAVTVLRRAQWLCGCALKCALKAMQRMYKATVVWTQTSARLLKTRDHNPFESKSSHYHNPV